MRGVGRHVLGNPGLPEGRKLSMPEHASGERQAYRLPRRGPALSLGPLSVRLLRRTACPTPRDPHHGVLSLPRQSGSHEAGLLWTPQAPEAISLTTDVPRAESQPPVRRQSGNLNGQGQARSDQREPATLKPSLSEASEGSADVA